jgi:hypothetical protein
MPLDQSAKPPSVDYPLGLPGLPAVVKVVGLAVGGKGG